MVFGHSGIVILINRAVAPRPAGRNCAHSPSLLTSTSSVESYSGERVGMRGRTRRLANGAVIAARRPLTLPSPLSTGERVLSAISRLAFLLVLPLATIVTAQERIDPVIISGPEMEQGVKTR